MSVLVSPIRYFPSATLIIGYWEGQVHRLRSSTTFDRMGKRMSITLETCSDLIRDDEMASESRERGKREISDSWHGNSRESNSQASSVSFRSANLFRCEGKPVCVVVITIRWITISYLTDTKGTLLLLSCQQQQLTTDTRLCVTTFHLTSQLNIKKEGKKGKFTQNTPKTTTWVGVTNGEQLCVCVCSTCN